MSGRKKGKANPKRAAANIKTPIRKPALEVSEMESRAIDAYLSNGFNKTQALLEAGYAEKSAGVQASRVFKRDRVKKEIKRRTGHLLKKRNIKKEEVLEEIIRLAFSNLGDVAEWERDTLFLKGSSDLSIEELSGISEIDIVPNKHGNKVKVKQHNKLRALELLCKYFGLLVDRKETTHNVTGSVLVLPENNRSPADEAIDVTPRKPLKTQGLAPVTDG